MDYRELRPAPALQPYIRCYWTLRADASPDSAPQRVLPDGCVEIVINLGSRFVRHDASGRTERQPRELVVGPTTRHMTIAPTGPIRLVGIRFAPAGAVPFLSVPPEDVRDAAPSLADAAPPLEDEVVDRLAAASYGMESPVLDVALGRRLARARRLADHRVLTLARATFAADRPLSVDTLTSLTGLGARQIERVYRANVGFGPGLLSRLARFQRVVRDIESARRISWAGFAAQHGYADQSHLAREFREFSGTTLTRYVAELHPMSDHFHSAPGTDDRPPG